MSILDCFHRAGVAFFTLASANVIGSYVVRQQKQLLGAIEAVRPQFYVPHQPARSLKQSCRIIKLGTTKKSDIDMSFKRIDIGESSVTDASRGTPVMPWTGPDGVHPAPGGDVS